MFINLAPLLDMIWIEKLTVTWRSDTNLASSLLIPQSNIVDGISSIYLFFCVAAASALAAVTKSPGPAFVKVQISLGNYHASNMKGKKGGMHCPVVHFNLLIHGSRGGAWLDII